MKKYYLLVSLCLLFFTNGLLAQSNKIRFKYRIDGAKMAELGQKGLFITEKGNSLSPKYQLCSGSTLKTLITLKDNILILDPWTITKDGSQMPLAAASCDGQTGIINSKSPNNLIIDLPRKNIGDPTEVIRFHYDALIIGINSINLKWRQPVTDYKGVSYNSAISASALSLGIGLGYSRGFTSFTRRGSNNYSITLGGSLGFSSVDLSKEILKTNISLTGVSTNLVLSPTINLTLARNDIGIIFAFGHEYITRNSEAWAYHGKAFWGLGIATGLKL